MKLGGGGGVVLERICWNNGLIERVENSVGYYSIYSRARGFFLMPRET